MELKMLEPESNQQMNSFRNLIISYLNNFSTLNNRITNRNRPLLKIRMLFSTKNWSSIESMCTEVLPKENNKPFVSNCSFTGRYYQKVFTVISSALYNLSSINNCIYNKGVSRQLATNYFRAKVNWRSIEFACIGSLAFESEKSIIFSSRGTARFNQQEFREALNDFEMAIALDSRNIQAILGRARVLLHDGQDDEAEKIAQSILNDDIGDQEAHELLKQIAFQKFKRILTSKLSPDKLFTFDDCMHTIPLLIKSLDTLTIEELRLLHIRLIKLYCSYIFIRDESDESDYLPLLTLTLGGTFIIMNDFKMALSCFYVSYNLIFKSREDPESHLKLIALLKIAFCYLSIGQLENAHKILSQLRIYSINNPTIKLFAQLTFCNFQLQTGILDEPLQIIKNVRREAEERGFTAIVVYADTLILRTQLFSSQFGSAADSIDRIQQSLCEPRVNTELSSNLVYFLKFMSLYCRAISPTKNKTTEELNMQLSCQMPADLIPNYESISIDRPGGRDTMTSLKAFQSSMEAISSGFTSTGAVQNREAVIRAQALYETRMEDYHRLQNSSMEFMYGVGSASLNRLIGNTEKCNLEFRRCISLARRLKHERIGHVCFRYSIALLAQRNYKEAFTISLEAEEMFVKLYRNAHSEDQRIAINQEKYLLGKLQVLIILQLYQSHEKALYAFERILMPALRKTIYIPLPVNESDLTSRSNELIFRMRKFTSENKSLLIYIFDASVLVLCWDVYADHNDIYMDKIDNQTASEAGDTDEINIQFGNLFIQNVGNLFRTFPGTSRSNLKTKCWLTTACNKIGEMLVNILDDVTGIKRIIIIPDRRLYIIPYVLIGNISESNSLDDYPLLKNFTISISPSFWALSPTWMKSESPILSRDKCSIALLIGNPESNLPQAEKEVILAAHRLEHSKDLEVLSLTQHLATKKKVLDILGSCIVVHIASHGNLNSDEEHIRAGAIQLNDGTLDAVEIEKLDLHKVDLMFVNCCYGGSGLLYEEGPVGLTRALLIAGVRNIVAFNGEVPDSKVTCAFVKAFYNEWINCRESDTALRAAQIRMLEKGVHHNFWSGYKVICQRA